MDTTSTALTDAGLPMELADKILMEKAALTIQSFFRRSLFRVQYVTDYYDFEHWPRKQFARKASLWPHMQPHLPWSPHHAQHRSGEFTQRGVQRTVKHRYKPLGIVLKGMMKTIVDCQKMLRARKQFYKKRKNQYFRVTLLRRTKLFGDLPIITVTNNTVFHP